MGPFSSQISLFHQSGSRTDNSLWWAQSVPQFQVWCFVPKGGTGKTFPLLCRKITKVLSMADIVAIPSFSSSLRRTYSVTMRKVRILKSSFRFWERQFSCKASLGKTIIVSTLFSLADNACEMCVRQECPLTPFPQVQRRTGRVPWSNRKWSSLHFLSGKRNHVSRGN